MYLDTLNLFSNSQAITGTSAASTSYIDTLSTGDKGVASTRVIAVINTAFTGTSQALTVLFQTSTDHSTWTTLWTSKSFTTLTAGTKLNLPPVPSGCKRYLQLTFNCGTTEAAGVITAGLVLNESLNDATVIAGSP